LVPVFNDDAVDFASVEIDHILRLLPGFLRTGPFHFNEPEVSATS
jgi:hypothetical protein